MILTVSSSRPTAKNLALCSPTGTLARLMHLTSADISFRSVYSFNCPVWWKRKYWQHIFITHIHKWHTSAVIVFQKAKSSWRIVRHLCTDDITIINVFKKVTVTLKIQPKKRKYYKIFKKLNNDLPGPFQNTPAPLLWGQWQPAQWINIYIDTDDKTILTNERFDQ